MSTVASNLKDAGSNLWNRLDINTIIACIAALAFCVASAFMVKANIKATRALNEFKNEAIELKVQITGLQTSLGGRFAYVTADMDAAKAQISELSGQVTRLNTNGLKLIGYLENKDTGKNAQRKR